MNNAALRVGLLSYEWLDFKYILYTSIYLPMYYILNVK